MNKQINEQKKDGILNTEYGKYLLSDENIYLSIYSLNSYIFEYNLLNQDDRILYHQLQDKFDRKCINNVILQVRERIENLLENENEYIETKVYFKPKKLAEGKLEFRPLHTTDLITQIAIVSMLHLFIYEIPTSDNSKLRLSNLSRLIPSDFYGNRVSVKPEYLFKPWKKQYQKYNQNSNDALKKYHTSLEYKYEVTLDLKNFFPTVNPLVIYYYIIEHLPAHLTDADMQLMKTVLRKLLFCKLKEFDEKMEAQYYKISPEDEENNANVEKAGKDKNQNLSENEYENTKERLKSCGFVRGIPQGLPQSYFLGNIYMIFVSEIFRNKFKGRSYFYVDDSVIFTNNVQEDEEQFKNQLLDINRQIKKEAEEILESYELENTQIYPKGTKEYYEGKLYGVSVHIKGKSSYTRLDRLDESEVYLKCISREMSQAGSDFFRMYSDEENRNMEKKFAILSEQVKAKRDQLEEIEREKESQKAEKKDTNNADNSEIEKKEQEQKETGDARYAKKFKERLTRYYRFFEYRKQKLAAMHQPENESDKSYKEELKKIIYSGLLDKNHVVLKKIVNEEKLSEEEKKEILSQFMSSYSADIWDAAVGMYLTFADEKEAKELRKYILKINEICYGKKSVKCSYLQCTYREFLDVKEIKSCENDTEEYLRVIYDDPYKSLKRLAMVRLKGIANKHYEVAEYYCRDFQKESEEEILKKLLSENDELPERMKVVCANTQKIFRMVLNTIYSYLFGVEISDYPVLAKNSKKVLTYGELRILSFLRNPWFTTEEFQKREISLTDRPNKYIVDYSIMRVIEIFFSFVKEPVKIDKLIITHKYTCDVWKNGSKHLYFYTLHNQEHAVILIQNIVKLIHAIDFLKISAIDYYILFLACYLHDISMVKIPAVDSFLVDTDKADELAKSLLDDYHKEFSQMNVENETMKNENYQRNDIDILSVKKYMLDSYKKIEGYFESTVRDRHAGDSADEIRQRAEIGYLDIPMRELVAEVAEAHCADERNIYGAKSNASKQLMSIKFDKILLRLADLLDMSSYRVSRPILHHNMEQMSEESAFHWISHLLTQGYELHTEYEIKRTEGTKPDHKQYEKNKNMEGIAERHGDEGVLVPKTITEKLILEIPVDMSQMSTLNCKKLCEKVKIDRTRISQQGITLICGEECEKEQNSERSCNFLCQWFCVKNDYLIKELAALKNYLNKNKNNYFKCEIEIQIKCNDKTSIDARQFEILNNYIRKKNESSN